LHDRLAKGKAYFAFVVTFAFYLFILQLDATNKRIAHIDEGLHVFIKVQLGLFSAMIVLFAVVMYYATYFM